MATLLSVEQLRASPSYADGIHYTTEALFLKEAASHLLSMGTKLKLDVHIVATAVLYFQRFYLHRSYKKFPREVTAICALFLAIKAENHRWFKEQPALRDLIKASLKLVTSRSQTPSSSEPSEEEIELRRQKVLDLELYFLLTIGFELSVSLPYDYLSILEETSLKPHVLLSLNSILGSTLMLQYEPHVIACAAILATAERLSFQIPTVEGKQFYEYEGFCIAGGEDSEGVSSLPPLDSTLIQVVAREITSFIENEQAALSHSSNGSN